MRKDLRGEGVQEVGEDGCISGDPGGVGRVGGDGLLPFVIFSLDGLLRRGISAIKQSTGLGATERRGDKGLPEEEVPSIQLLRRRRAERIGQGSHCRR